MLPDVVTGNPPDDVPHMEVPLCIRQAEGFLASASHPATYYMAVVNGLSNPLVMGTVWEKHGRSLINDAALKVVQAVSAELKAANEARKSGDTRATKPVDLYRKYRVVLRQVGQSKAHGFLARALATELYLEQTQSDGDLETPDYIDPYTGEKELTFEQFRDQLPDVHEPGLAELLKYIGQCPDPDGDPIQGLATPVAVNSWNHELNLIAQRLKVELGWTDEQAGQFINANRQFVGGDDEEEPEEDRGFVPSTLEERELKLDSELFWSGRAAAKAFNHRRTLIFNRMKHDGERRKKGEWHADFWRSMESRHEYHDLLREIERMADEDVVTAAAFYLTVESDDNGYGVRERDVASITGRWVDGVRIKLLGYAQEWEDSLLDLIQDARITAKHIFGEEDIRRFADLAEKVQAKSMPSVHADPTKTRWYNMAYQEAIAAGGTLEEADNAGWAAWRFAMDQRAAMAYNKVFKETGNRSSAMRAFWAQCPRDIPRPVDHIKAIQGNLMGLVLADHDRRVDWHIAALKLKNDELEVGDKLRAMLKEKLAKVNSAKEFLALL